MRLRGAVLGTGNIALRGHAPQWVGDETLRAETEIVAVADLSDANREAAAAVFPRARRYEDAVELLDNEELDFCDICTPPFTHWPLIEAAAARGLHLVCEKPLAPTLDEALRIAGAVRSARVVFHPCHQYLHSPQWRAVSRLLPRLGRVYLAEYDVNRTRADQGNPHWRPSWRTDRRLAGGGILVDHGGHIFYQLRSVLGQPAAVQATVRTLRHRDYDVEDTAFVTLDYGDCLAHVRLYWAARRRQIRFRFLGEEGELTGDETGLLVEAGGVTERIGFPTGLSSGSSHSEWYGPLLRDFFTRVRAGDRSTQALDEAVHVTQLIGRAYESSEEGRALPV
jgi:predicted dehydrogenase